MNHRLAHAVVVGIAIMELACGPWVIDEVVTWVGVAMRQKLERFAADNGEYLDSWDDLMQYVRVVDPDQFRYMVKSEDEYYYGRVPGGYELYAIGPDRLPKTADDILPAEWWGKCKFTWGRTGWIEEGSLAPMDLRGRAAQ